MIRKFLPPLLITTALALAVVACKPSPIAKPFVSLAHWVNCAGLSAVPECEPNATVTIIQRGHIVKIDGYSTGQCHVTLKETSPKHVRYPGGITTSVSGCNAIKAGNHYEVFSTGTIKIMK